MSPYLPSIGKNLACIPSSNIWTVNGINSDKLLNIITQLTSYHKYLHSLVMKVLVKKTELVIFSTNIKCLLWRHHWRIASILWRHVYLAHNNICLSSAFHRETPWSRHNCPGDLVFFTLVSYMNLFYPSVHLSVHPFMQIQYSERKVRHLVKCCSYSHILSKSKVYSLMKNKMTNTSG